MNSRDLIIGDIIIVDGGKSTYQVEILNKTPVSIKYQYSDIKNGIWKDNEEFDRDFKIIEKIKEGSGKSREKIKRVYTSRTTKKKK